MASSTFLLIFSITFLVAATGFRIESKALSTSRIQWTITVNLDRALKADEQVGISGDADYLGAWLPNKARFLSRTTSPTRWTLYLQVPANCTVNYRYFVGVVAPNGDVQIREWETNIDGRTVQLPTRNIATTDRFGYIGSQKEVHRGWLNSGTIVELKFFHNPVQIETSSGTQTIYIKITPVDYDYLTLIRSSALANVEYARMQYGDSKFKDQPDTGVPYNTDDIVVFHITTNDFRNVAYKCGILDANRIPIGYQFIYPDRMSGSYGSIEVVLESSNSENTIGSVKIEYLIIKPLPSPQLNFRTTFANYWPKNIPPVDIGHRGLGKSYNPVLPQPPITENTIASFKAAGRAGADMVEFDIQLTKDLVPIIYHNYFVYVSRTGSTPRSQADLVKVLIKDVTYKQLINMRTYIIANDGSIVELATHNRESREDYRIYELFEDLLTRVNHTIGFDIEIKWPQMQNNGESESVQTIDKNVYMDRILDVMLRKNCPRLSYFSSLDADTCTMLRYKQNMYPVLFLGSMTDKFYVDPRSDNFIQNINHAQAMDLAGVIPNTMNFLTDPSRVELAKNLGQLIFIWGDDSDSTAKVNYFKSYKPNGIIYGDVDLYIPKGKTNIFENKSGFLEFLGKQCANRNSSNC